MDRNKKVLLIEDDYAIAELYQMILRRAGIEVLYSQDGRLGLAEARRTHPDLILLDIMLPYINGLQLLAQLKSDPKTKDIPVVILTNLGLSAIIGQAYEMGAQGYLLKVYLVPAQLVEVVEKFLQDPTIKIERNSIKID